MTYEEVQEQILNVLEESVEWLSLYDLCYWLNVIEDKSLESVLDRFVKEGLIEVNSEKKYRYIRSGK